MMLWVTIILIGAICVFTVWTVIKTMQIGTKQDENQNEDHKTTNDNYYDHHWWF